ncbi:hypothetical protein EE612_023197 [Oryza sativa]|jgi:hypothetical protein|uniref:Uncharacterized protein n=1 Tax=Oryza sativa subsp. indica TaxID=39946 RepID=B8AZM3_ORYSI|nr:hypothetical protein OsI_19023 [Oryza sativa Indica Group]KAB8095279.1 hypothetical protein EE612_023197 [Oryza sativa]
MPKQEGEGLSGAKDEPKLDDNGTEELLTLQDLIDSAVHHALINQSGVMVNTLTNMIKSVVDGLTAEHKITGPTYLQNNVSHNIETSRPIWEVANLKSTLHRLQEQQYLRQQPIKCRFQGFKFPILFLQSN